MEDTQPENQLLEELNTGTAWERFVSQVARISMTS